MDGRATPSGTATAQPAQDYTYDIIIVGAGISGINAAYRIQTLLPTSTFTILESRHELGGTWSLFKYPGIRSDSDLHTFGFPFYPWQKPNPIASGESIVEYLNETAGKFGIDRKIEFGRRVVGCDWRGGEQAWRMDVDVGDGVGGDGEGDIREGVTEGEGQERRRRKIYHAKFLILGTGYYNYETPLAASIPGIERFAGRVVHPQFWPESLDYTDKKMIIIGSGASAITILPAVVNTGVGSATMLQRSPSYILNMPQKKPGEKSWYDYLPRWLALKIVRFQFILMPTILYWFCKTFPNVAAGLIRKEARKALPAGFEMEPHFYPRYGPWDERMGFCPDNDFFECFHSGRARIVTDTIETVAEDGILLSSGEKLEADIIVTATGLNVQFLGKIDLSVDGHKVDPTESFIWRHAMLSSIPNLAFMMGYVHSPWTLGSDSSSRLLVRLIKHMQENNFTSATPRIQEHEMKDPLVPLNLSSTYIKAAVDKLPKSGQKAPWNPRTNHVRDNWNAKFADLKGGMEFGRVST